MAVLLNKPYLNYAAGTIAEFPKSTEEALILQNMATATTSAVTAGALTTSACIGTAAIAAGASSVVVTNPNVDKRSKVFAIISQAAADATLLYLNVSITDGAFTIYGNANATAVTQVDWVIFNGARGMETTN